MNSTKNFVKKQSLQIYKNNKYSAGGSVPSAVSGHFQKAPKIKDSIIWINFVNQLGLLRRIPGWPNQELHKLLVQYKTPFFDPYCDGGPSKDRRLSDDTVALLFDGSYCGTCHVRISDPWFAEMKKKIHPIEKTTLKTTAVDLFPNSRLACGIKLKSWMNEMIVTQPRAVKPTDHDVDYELDTTDMSNKDFDNVILR